MKYEMKLNPSPFSAMKKGLKTIEMRLNDEKRKNIKAGDQILFTQRENGETLLTTVKSVTPFKSFEELYCSYNKTLLGYEKNEKSSPDDMSQYYAQNEIEKYGVLAIEIELI